MKNIGYFVIFFALLTALGSCKDNEDDVITPEYGNFTITTRTMQGTAPYTIGETVLHPVLNRDFRITDYLFYINYVRLHKSDGSTVKVSDYFLYKYAVGDSVLNGDALVGDYVGVTFDVGIEESVNHGDPNQYAADNPLGVGSNMHWTTALGYLFLKIEGFSDTTAAGLPYAYKNFTYDMGLDTLYRTYTITKNFSITKGNTTNINLDVDINKFFSSDAGNIDLVNDNITHSTGDGLNTAIMIMDNFMTSLSYQ